MNKQFSDKLIGQKEQEAVKDFEIEKLKKELISMSQEASQYKQLS